ncbi:MAG: DUF3445 domain-containing protein [Burkholderiaceae bacterium]|nr:DUF3445 domain-containing protein [Burkholderiaceae bacterium]
MSCDAWPAIPAQLLGAQRTPFPVSATHQVRPDLYKLDAVARDDTRDDDRAKPQAIPRAVPRDELASDGVGLLRADHCAPRYLREKLALLDARAHPLVLVAPACDRDASEAALRQAVAMLAGAHPQLLAVSDACEGGVDFALSGIGLRDDTGRTCPVVALRADAAGVCARIASLPPPRRTLAALALSVQEDLVLMAITPEGFVAEAMSVAFASGWDPARKIGRRLFDIHQPVAEGEALRAASDNLARAMVGKGPFVRYVWTISDSDALARPPGHAVAAESVEALWFRCERQVTLPLAAFDRSLFLIRVFVEPLSTIARDEPRRSLIARALESMGDELVRYKGLEQVRALVRRQWGTT